MEWKQCKILQCTHEPRYSMDMLVLPIYSTVCAVLHGLTKCVQTHYSVATLLTVNDGGISVLNQRTFIRNLSYPRLWFTTRVMCTLCDICCNQLSACSES